MSFKEQFNRLKAQWPIIQEGRESVLLKEYEKVATEIGDTRFQAGVDAITRDGKYKYFPSLSEFMGFVPLPEDPVFVNCGNCMNGWVYAEGFDNGGNPYVVRCQCKKGGRP